MVFKQRGNTDKIILLEEIGKGVKDAFFCMNDKNIQRLFFIVIMLRSYSQWFYLPLEYRVQLVSMTCFRIAY
jgi:hypothetical protein